MRMFLLAITLWLSGAGQTAPPSQPSPAQLSSLEEGVARRFNDARQSAGFKPLAFRKDRRVRMEACSVALRGPDIRVEGDIVNGRPLRKNWYVASDPQAAAAEISDIATYLTPYRSVGVGVWFARTAQFPDGAYWVVVYPEHSAAHEAFWGHFYLTDDFEYVTLFDRYWKKNLPQECRDIKK